MGQMNWAVIGLLMLLAAWTPARGQALVSTGMLANAIASLTNSLDVVAFAGEADTLQTVTDLGNTTTNTIEALEFLETGGTAHTTSQLNASTRAVSAATLIGTTDYGIYVDASAGAVTVTLTNASAMVNYVVNVIKTDASANAVNIRTIGSDTISGETNQVLLVQYESLTLQARTGAWWVQ
jgi:hypothetical protein